MPRFILEIEVGNEGMRTVEDLAQALLLAGQKMNRVGTTDASIRDRNGNRVGSYRIEGI